MKAILILDMPSCCNECPIRRDDMDCCSYIMNTRSKTAFGYDTKRLDICPLKPMPKQKEHLNCEGCNHIECEYAEGWNDCIEEIEHG